MAARPARSILPTRSLAAAPRFPFLAPVSDRLTELQRQRALAQEQLAWLDKEIAREAGQAAPPPPRAVPLAPGPAPRAPAPADVDAILAQYQDEPDKLQKNIKLGCFLYFFVALGLLVLSVTAWYFLRMAH